MTARVGSTITVAAAAGSYSSHPSIARSREGDWLLVYSRSGEPEGELIHPPNDPRFVNVLVRSTDEGRTWSTPTVVPGPEWSGVECSGVAVMSDGAILLNQFRFGWPAVDEAREQWALGRLRPFVRDPADRRWRPVSRPGDWDAHRLPNVRTDEGSFVHRSTDDGASWETTRLAIEPYQGAFSPKGAVELDGGEVILPLGSHEHDPLAASLIVRSPDLGRTWGDPELVACAPGLIFSEPAAVAVDGRRLLVFSREETTGFIYQSVSEDRGASWQPPERLLMWGYPTHGTRLRDGRILIVYGHRRRPHGIRGSVSADGGATWGPEFVIRTGLRDSRDGFNLGYPSVIEYQEGELFVAYYAEGDDGTVGIYGTYVSVD